MQDLQQHDCDAPTLAAKPAIESNMFINNACD